MRLSQKQGQRLIALAAATLTSLISLPAIALDGGIKAVAIFAITGLAGIFVYPDKDVPPEA